MREYTFNDVTGQKFNRLTVLRLFDKTKDGIRYLCLCDCGKEKVIYKKSLVSGQSKSCGCLYKEKVPDLLGNRYDRLVVLEKTDKRLRGNVVWKCQCDCGNISYVLSIYLRTGQTRSCGCLRDESTSNRFKKDLTNKRFGKLVVIRDSGERNKLGTPTWLCKCDCGNYKKICTKNLMSGDTKSCGCLYDAMIQNRSKDLTDKRFERLLVLNRSEEKGNGIIWLCLCDCGNYKKVTGSSLISGHYKSCGCFNREASRNRLLGYNNPSWKGGIIPEYPKEWNENLREFVRNRDSRKCQYSECEYDDTKENKKLDVHHIDGHKENCKSDNLISLCHSHHRRVETNNPESYQYQFYQYTRSFEQ